MCLCTNFNINAQPDTSFLDSKEILNQIKIEYGENSDQYIAELLNLENYCDENNVKYYPEIAHLIKKNEVIIRQRHGIDSPEYHTAIRILDILCNGKFLDPSNFSLYSDDIISVIRYVEANLDKCPNNQLQFLCYITSLYLDISTNVQKALYYGTKFFSLVKDSDCPNLDTNYLDAVRRLISAYELNLNKPDYLKWVKDYFDFLDNKYHNNIATEESSEIQNIKEMVILIFLEYISPDQFPEIRDYLLNQLRIYNSNVNYLWTVLENWAYNEFYESLKAFDEIFLSSRNNYMDKAICNIFIGTGLADLKETGFEKSMPYFEKSRKFVQNPLDLFDIGIRIYNSTGSFDLQKKLFWAEKNISLFNQCKTIFGTEDDVRKDQNISFFNNIANLYCDLGLYYKAINLETELLNIYHSYLEKSKTLYRNILGNLGEYYSFILDYNKALEYNTKALKLYSEEEENELIIPLHNSALYISKLGDNNKAIEIENTIINILDKTDVKDTYYYELYTGALCYLAYYYYNNNETMKAIEIGNQALSLAKSSLGTSHPYIPTFLDFLASYYAKIDIPKAILIEAEAYDLYAKIFGKTHDFYMESSKKMMNLQNLIQDKEGVISVSNSISTNLFDYIKSLFLFLPKNEREIFWQKSGIFFKEYFPYIAYSYDDSTLNSNAYNISLLSKGFLLNSELLLKNHLSKKGSEELLNTYNKIRDIKYQIDQLYKTPVSKRTINIESLESQAEEMERKLLQESCEFEDYSYNLTITWLDIKNHLKNNDAAIEFVSFPLTNDSTIYIAYVLRSDIDSPILVKLFEEKEISSLNDNDLYNNIKGCELIWHKLYSKLDGIENVYFAPDGILHQIGIEYFPDFDNPQKTVSDRFNIYRLSSTRQLALKKTEITSNNVTIFGGIKYDITPEKMVFESRKYEIGPSRVFNSMYNLADSISLRSGKKFLPFTLKEANSVKDLFQNAHIPFLLITGEKATEESFRNLSGSENNILHIATHGFYWQKEEADNQAKSNESLLFMTQFGNNARLNLEDKALTRTGLFMAGANNVLLGKIIPDDIDDGILTAQEIANIDLRGLDLVVLSACQTGMGDISSDGVLGLQRGFKKAGANTILMSLWDVNDEATQILMTEFYRNYLNGKSKREALLTAQKMVRNTPGFDDPEYWAAFILLDALN